MRNLTSIFKHIQPAVTLMAHYPGKKSSKNEEPLKLVTIYNIRYGMGQIREKRPILRELEAEGKLKIIGHTTTLWMGLMNISGSYVKAIRFY